MSTTLDGSDDPIERLRSVLCDPEGVVCIEGSPMDRMVIGSALLDLEHLVSCARKAEREKVAKFIEYRGQCAVAMINSEERIEEKKAFAWDCLQHAIAIREMGDK